VAQESDFGVYFEYVVPQTSFLVVSGLSEADARLTAQRQLSQQPGFRILGVYPITEKLTYTRPKQPQQATTQPVLQSK
jgi:hypothetical protein